MPHFFGNLTRLIFLLSLVIAISNLTNAQDTVGQQTRVLTDADYRRAERFMGYNTTPLVSAVVKPTWLADGRFWYRKAIGETSQFLIVDPKTGTISPAFDHEKLAAALSTASGEKLDPQHLSVSDLTFSGDSRSVTFNLKGHWWSCDINGAKCESTANPAAAFSRPPANGNATVIEALSPDKRRAAFIRNNNLWVRDTVTNAETQLTMDGVKDFGYATDNAGWIRSDRPILVWSPDSKKIATFQQDQRGVGEMYLVSTNVGHPELEAWKYPLAGDQTVTTIQRVVIDVDNKRVVRLKLAPDQHRSTLCDDIACRGGEWADVQWSPDSTHLAFVSTSRDHRAENFRIADASTGDVRDVFNEVTETPFESGNGRVNWRYLPATNELIWFSERDNWGHLYLYDLQTGKVKQQITTGEWNVTQVLRMDEKNRVLYFLGVGREKGRDPYFIHFYSIHFDGSSLKLLTPEDATHDVSLSPDGPFFEDNYSTPDVPQTGVLRNLDGTLITNIEKADISHLLAAGWRPPQRITVKARDGVTDLYGLMYTPTNLDTNRKYPIINHIYPGPQTGSVGSRNFSVARGDAQALAELGFVVIEVDGMGTPWRSKKFHDAYYGNMGDNTLPDQVAAMKELATRYKWIDSDRAGIYGHSGGGYAAAGAMFRYPEFFKVGISEAGNHENRNYEDDWAEKWQGLLRELPEGKTNYDNQANQLIAKNLKGHLLLAHGTMDNNVPPYNTLLVVDALIKANRDFDLLLLPNRTHGFGNEPYMIRRRWDYFVRYLMGAEPPGNYEMHSTNGRSQNGE